ncbi:MAG: DUF87 domain-containing protein [Anaerolineae bacterium]
MSFIEAPTNFYLGREYDPQARKLTDRIVYYDSRDLTTHAIVVGMTGSGKTGLCISMLEEAALDNIPAIIIDPKGDICNLALVFPELRGEDFAPWVNPDSLRPGQTVQDYAAEEAEKWRKGLDDWDIVPERLTWLKHAVKLSIYTPGSDAGLPISILASLRAPRMEWLGNEEIIRERITSTVTALFTLAGKNVQPLQDVEHVFVSNILEFNWRNGRDMTLEDIIFQIKQPPFERLGAFEVNQYFPERQRYRLAIELNNIIAAPSFQSWINGEPLDIQQLLYQPNGRARVSIFYTAHLSDQERMFITTLILESMIAWMRTQQGTTSLRALLYIDEMYGYFPPHPRNPATKQPIMRLLKQARAFGVGLILATQNPGDLDYKGLGNAGTWFIGRLNSDNDRQRIMEGLQSLASANDELSLREVAQLIADVPRRVFLMRNLHREGPPVLVQTRWAMSYLAGPLTRTQIATLMDEPKRALLTKMQHTSAWGRAPSAPPPPPPPPEMLRAPASAPEPPPMMPPSPYGPPAPTVPNPNPEFTVVSQSAAPVPAAAPQAQPQAASSVNGFMTTRPPIPSEVQQYFLPATLSVQQAFANRGMTTPAQAFLAYLPSLFAQVQVRFAHRASQTFYTQEYAFIVPDVPANGLILWDQHHAPTVDARMVSAEPFGQALFQQVPASLLNTRRYATLQRELIDVVAATVRLTILHHPQFKIFSDPNRDPSEFYAQVQQIARERADEEGDRISQRYGQMYDRLESRRQAQERRLAANQQELRDRKREHTYTTGEAILSIFRGRTNYTLSRMSRAGRLSRQTELDLQANKQEIAAIVREMEALEAEYRSVMQQTMDKWARIATQIEELPITPFKKDIAVAMFGIGWLPHYYVQTPGQPLLIPAM